MVIKFNLNYSKIIIFILYFFLHNIIIYQIHNHFHFMQNLDYHYQFKIYIKFYQFLRILKKSILFLKLKLSYQKNSL